MRGYVFIIVGAVGVALAFLSFRGSSTDVAAPAPIRFPYPHVYDNPSESISDIHITVVYFVPRDMIPASSEQWMIPIEKELVQLQKFHTSQFRGSSRITYVLHPTPIRGEKPRSAYDIDDLRHNDPEMLRPVLDEAMSAAGYSLNAGPPYHVLFVLYEGAGAGGATHVGLLSRSFFERADTRTAAGTFLAHEFYHTLGVPDAYQTVPKVFSDGTEFGVELLKSRDIMGRVRIPLEETYLDPVVLTAMGL